MRSTLAPLPLVRHPSSHTGDSRSRLSKSQVSVVEWPAEAHLKSPLTPSCCQMLTSVVPTEPRIRPVCVRKEVGFKNTRAGAGRPLRIA